MASLRLTFPEKEQPTVIALTGARLTIGRLPFNTIQIIDRTVSGFHAELISEHGHYRLHDRGSSNGTFVNGQKIADYHLNEACTITFGTVEAQFSPEAVDTGEEAENFPTRSEINSVRKENAELKATVEALREETAALRLARPLENGDVALAVTKEEFEKVVVEREGLKEERLKQEDEINRLKTDLAVLKRDRVNLQLAYDGVQREITELRAKAGGVEDLALQPKAAAAALAAQAPASIPAPTEEIRVEVPAAQTAAKPAPAAEPPAAAPVPVKALPATPSSPIKPFAPLPKVPAATPASPTETKAPAPVVAPSAPAVPVSPRPPIAAPAPMKAPSAPSAPVKPFSPLPKAPAVAATVVAKPVVAAPNAPAPGVTPAAPVKAPPGLGSGIRPLARPPMAASAPADGGSTNTLPNAPTTRLAQRPQPSVKLPVQPTVKLSAVPAANVGPKGTQKLS